MVLFGRICCKDPSNFYLVILSLSLIAFSLNLCIDERRRSLMLVTLGVQRANGHYLHFV